jgi:transposase-like protein
MHPGGLSCPGCGASKAVARIFRRSQRGFSDYRCNACQRVYNLYSGTIFAGSRLPPAKVVLLLRGICKGESSLALASELKLSRTTVHTYRQKVQQNGYAILEQGALADERTETDEMFQNAGWSSPQKVSRSEC